MDRQATWLLATLAILTIGLTSTGEAALVDYWRFDGNLADQAASGRYGVPSGSVSFSNSVPAALGGGQSLSLDGNSWVTIASNPPTLSSGFALSFWVNQDGQSQVRDYDRITWRSDTMEVGLRKTGNGRLIYYQGGGKWVETGYTVPASGWHHAVFSCNGANMRVFVDGAPVFTGEFNQTPSGTMRIGATGRVDYPETIKGKLDDMALWDNTLTPWAAQMLSSGQLNPGELKTLSVTSTPAQWMRSTVRRSGGELNTDWTPSSEPIPDAATFTQPASAATDSALLAAASDLGLGTLLGEGGNGSPAGVQYHRTTFEIDPEWDRISANITLATDRGAQVFINGVEVARETTWSDANWTRPYCTLSIAPDGTISDTTLFDWVAPRFNAWKSGTNELILAVRDADASTATGGVVFRMDLVASVPEPATCCLLGLGALVSLAFRRLLPGRRSSNRSATAHR